MPNPRIIRALELIHDAKEQNAMFGVALLLTEAEHELLACVAEDVRDAFFKRCRAAR